MAKSSRASAQSPARPVSATGFLADSWLNFQDQPAALILNPDASPGAVLAWCYGEVQCLLKLTNAIGGFSASEMIATGELTALFQHRLEPLERVLESVISEMCSRKRRNGGEVVSAPATPPATIEAPLAALCALVAYAIDAERVLSNLSFNAGVIPELEVLMSQACDTWRNPNCDGQLASHLVDVQGFIAMQVESLVLAVREHQ